MTEDQTSEFLSAARPVYLEAMADVRSPAAGSEVSDFLAAVQKAVAALAALARKIFGDGLVAEKQAEVTDALIEWANQSIDEMDLSGHIPVVQKAIREAAKREAAKRIPALVDQYLRQKEA